MSGQTIEALVARGNGNPLFLEQATLAVREQPLEVRERSATPPVPATLEEAIRARIGALPIEAREVLLAAAVIGQRFTYDAVAAVTGQHAELDAALQELAGRRLVQRWREYPEVTYRFAHGLIQEVAYGSLPHPEQQVLEARVADWLLSDAALGGADSAQFIGDLDRLTGSARRDAPTGAGDLAPAPGATDEPATAWPRAMQQGRRNALLARLVLSELSAARRASVVLCLQHGYTYSTAGEALGLSREEVQSHLYEARQLFRRLYEARNATYQPATEGAISWSHKSVMVTV